MENNDDKKVIGIEEAFAKLKEWWVLIIFIAGLIATWTNFSNRLDALEKAQAKMDPTFLQIQKDIVEIKTTLEFIKQRLGE